MKRLMLVTVLFLSGCSAPNEWMYYAGTNEVDAYYNPSTVKTAGGIVTVWVVYDFATVKRYPDDTMYFSTKGQIEINCYEERETLVNFKSYPDAMGEGIVVRSHNAGNEKFASISIALLRLVCK